MSYTRESVQSIPAFGRKKEIPTSDYVKEGHPPNSNKIGTPFCDSL